MDPNDMRAVDDSRRYRRRGGHQHVLISFLIQE
jgi:hypothetical protein